MAPSCFISLRTHMQKSAQFSLTYMPGYVRERYWVLCEQAAIVAVHRIGGNNSRGSVQPPRGMRESADLRATAVGYGP